MGGWSAFTKQTMQGKAEFTRKQIDDLSAEAVNATNIKKLSNSSGLSVNVINQIIKDDISSILSKIQNKYSILLKKENTDKIAYELEQIKDELKNILLKINTKNVYY